eukprot:TRINITY_DN61803_c0_g1_i1.p1 TRINITY_DN61803_c0_g1~~TRINITY_DN61803_c0_g1_i1.p1  ORF type:complete len:537 (+),score=81.81 TRINITY_DN61803_c0_g1_i1:65-1675(+)
MDLGFAAADEVEGDWGDDEDLDEPIHHKVITKAPDAAADDDDDDEVEIIETKSSLPVKNSQPIPPEASPPAVAPAAFSDSPPRSKIHSNPRTRYFVIKSNSHKNLVLSIENNVWATQRHNEDKFNDAFKHGSHVILIFSVNNSGCFQGYAKMLGRVGSSDKTHVFRSFGRAFDVRWLRLDELDFSEVGDITNPWNEHKSVKISRDGQELPNEVGARLCELFDLRVYKSDPAGYTCDSGEVETGGHDPHAGLQTSAPPVAPGIVAGPQPSGPPPSAYGHSHAPPVLHAHAAVSYGAAPLHGAPLHGAPVHGTPAPGLGPSPYGFVPPWGVMGFPATSWGYAIQRARDLDSYSSYSYSDSEPEKPAQAPVLAPPLPMTPAVPQEPPKKKHKGASAKHSDAAQTEPPSRDRRRRRQEATQAAPTPQGGKEAKKEKKHKKEKKQKEQGASAPVAQPEVAHVAHKERKSRKEHKDGGRRRRGTAEESRGRRRRGDRTPQSSAPPQEWRGSAPPHSAPPSGWHGSSGGRAPPGEWTGACPLG